MPPRDVVKRDMAESADAFQQVIWPIVGGWLGGGDLVPVEGRDDREMFDIYAGIDAWHLENNERRIRGIASRVQKHPWLFTSFTVRKSRATGTETEFAKRLRAIRNPEEGWLFPAITVQGYVHEGEMIGAGVVHSRDLYEFIATGRGPIHHDDPHNRRGPDYDVRVNRKDGNEYFVVWWERLRRTNIRIRTIGDERLADRLCRCRRCSGQLSLEDAILGVSREVGRPEVTIEEFDRRLGAAT